MITREDSVAFTLTVLEEALEFIEDIANGATYSEDDARWFMEDVATRADAFGAQIKEQAAGRNKC